MYVAYKFLLGSTVLNDTRHVKYTTSLQMGISMSIQSLDFQNFFLKLNFYPFVLTLQHKWELNPPLLCDNRGSSPTPSFESLKQLRNHLQ